MRKIALALAAIVAVGSLVGCAEERRAAASRPGTTTSRYDNTTTVQDFTTSEYLDLESEVVEEEEEERTTFTDVLDMFENISDRSEMTFMWVEGADGERHELSIKGFREQLKSYVPQAQVQSNGGLYAKDGAGIILSTYDNDDGSVVYEMCDANVLEIVKRDDGYINVIQPLKSLSRMLTLYIGMGENMIPIQLGNAEKVDSDILDTNKWLYTHEDYQIELYSAAGLCFYYRMTLFDTDLD